MRLAPLSAVVLASCMTAARAENPTLLCIADQSIGYSMEGQNWTFSRFNSTDKKYVVKPVPERDHNGEKVNYEVTQFGKSTVDYECYRWPDDAEQIACGGIGWNFMLNFKSLRFQDTYTIGYVDGRDDGQNTPSMTIGKCAPL